MTNQETFTEAQVLAAFAALNLEVPTDLDLHDRSASDSARRALALMDNLMDQVAQRSQVMREIERLRQLPHPHVREVRPGLLEGLSEEDCRALHETLGATQAKCPTCLEDALERIVELPAAMLVLFDMVFALWREHRYLLSAAITEYGLSSETWRQLAPVLNPRDWAVRAPLLATIEPGMRRDCVTFCAQRYLDPPDGYNDLSSLLKKEQRFSRNLR